MIFTAERDRTLVYTALLRSTLSFRSTYVPTHAVYQCKCHDLVRLPSSLLLHSISYSVCAFSQCNLISFPFKLSHFLHRNVTSTLLPPDNHSLLQQLRLMSLRTVRVCMKLSSYVTDNTLRLHKDGQSVNSLQGNNRCLL